MLHAEKRCRKLYGGKVPWSPEVTEAHLQVELWTLMLRRLKGCHISARTILRKNNQAKVITNTNVSMLEATGLLHYSYVRYREVIKKGKERRVVFINDLATAKSKAGKISVTNTLKPLQEQEAVRETWVGIHRMDGSAHIGKGLSMVVAPDEEGEWTERVTRAGIEQASLLENENRFTQSKNTTLMVSPMVEEL